MNTDIVVLIPHYNNPTGLEKSLASIVSSQLINVLIVDDGSATTPDEQEFNDKFRDRLQLIFLYNQANQGIEHTLNNGLKYIQQHLKSMYVARLDCGDTCAPERLNKQKQYLDAHEDVYLIGSWVEFVDGQGRKVYTYKAPSYHNDILNNMYLKCSFIHPSVMFRTAALNEIGLYPLNYKAAEDYAFFFRFIKKYKTHIIPEILTFCEVNTGGISYQKRSIQLKSKVKVLLDNKTASPYFLLGLIRNFALILLPYSIVAKAKTILFK